MNSGDKIHRCKVNKEEIMTEILCGIMLVAFFVVMIGVGFYSRKHATNVSGFVLGGRSAGPWLTAFAFGTSYFSAVIFVGYAGQFGWNFGLASTWAGLGNAFIGSLLAWNVLGRRTRIMTQYLDAKTMPDFFGKRFNSVPLKVAASVIVFIFLIPYTASLYNGLSSLGCYFSNGDFNRILRNFRWLYGYCNKRLYSGNYNAFRNLRSYWCSFNG